MRPWITTLTLAFCTAEHDCPPLLEMASPEQCSTVRRCLRLCNLLLFSCIESTCLTVPETWGTLPQWRCWWRGGRGTGRDKGSAICLFVLSFGRSEIMIHTSLPLAQIKREIERGRNRGSKTALRVVFLTY